MRMHAHEKAKLKRLAGDESISQMIRRTFGLDAEEPESGPAMDATPDSDVALAGSGSDEALEQMTKQFHNQGYTWPVARRMAREELG